MNIDTRRIVAEFVLCLTVVFSFGYIVSARRAILSWAYRVPLVGWFLSYNFPPSDYYDPILDIMLDKAQCRNTFSCKYDGRYEIYILGLDSATLSCDAEISIALRNQEGEVVLKRSARDLQRYKSYTKDDVPFQRYVCFVLFAPEDIPLNTKLTAEFDFNEKFIEDAWNEPGVHIVFVKNFDK